MAALPELSVLVAYTTNITLSGAAPAEGGYTPANTEAVLVAGQTDMTTNGPYTVNTSGAWTRHAEFDTSAEFVPGSRFFIRKGTHAGRYFYFANGDTPTLGTTVLNFYAMSEARPFTAGPRLERVDSPGAAPQIRVAPVAGLTPGTYGIPNIGVTQEGTVSFIESATIVIPTGMVTPYAGPSEPAGWLFCDGRAVSRTTYQTLYDTIGTTFGAGDGSTTFNLPDLRGRAPIGVGQGTGLTNRALAAQVGAETHTLTETQTPLHTHGVGRNLDNNFQGGGTKQGITDLAVGAVIQTQGAGGGAAHNNMQPSIALNFVIKT